jgi:hypothetical protein
VEITLGVAGAVLSNLARDGGWNADSRTHTDELNKFKQNLDLRIASLTQQSAAKSDTLRALLPEVAATFKIHLDSVAQYKGPIETSANALAAARRMAESNSPSRSTIGLPVSDPAAALAALIPSVVRNRIQLDLPNGTLRSNAPSIVGLNDDLRFEQYGSRDPLKQTVVRERQKLVASLNGQPLASTDRMAAAIYAVGKVRLAGSVARDPGNADMVRALLQDSQSARFFLQGVTKGVVDRHLDNGRGVAELVLTSDPRLMAGTIWSTVLMEESSSAGFGDWGLPTLSVRFDSAPIDLSPPDIPISAPDLPGGASVDDNIRQTLLLLRAEAFFLQDPGILSRETFPLDTLFWFKDKVDNFRDWDYKRKGADSDYSGNFNYGATGAALGLSLETLQRAAGLVQLRDRTSYKLEFGNPNGAWPYGDDPNDSNAIEDGYNYYQQNKDKWKEWLTGRGKP